MLRKHTNVLRFLRKSSLSCEYVCPSCRSLTSSTRRAQHDGQPFRTRLRKAWNGTKIQWKPIPVGLGIASVGALQLYRTQARNQRPQEEQSENEHEGSEQSERRPRKRQRIKPSGGGWQVYVIATLPLKGLSRLWGRFNELDIPYYLRVPGFKLYSYLFGVNLSEVSEPDLHSYKNLASFFYRTLRPGVRPIDSDSTAILSPADGRILQFGTIEHGEVEQVKGVTYSLDALLGTEESGSTQKAHQIPVRQDDVSPEKASEIEREDKEFAKLNGISYTLPNLFSGPKNQNRSSNFDASTTPRASSEAEVRADLALGDGSTSSWFYSRAKTPTQLHYMVIYLAPGDYHRFHSPVSWVVERRRHFAGELYSVSPWLQRKLPGLFTLNERVALLGRWRWGFFGFVPVGATNVGSIKINFDSELRTNSLTTDTAADKAAEEASDRGEPFSGYSEATYSTASKLLGGHSLKRGEEMGGFMLGSSIVLVFEAPKGRRRSFDEGFGEGDREGGWTWTVKKDQRVKYGEAIGHFSEV